MVTFLNDRFGCHFNILKFADLLSIITDGNSRSKKLRLREVCWLHSCLCSAAEDINSLYSIQLLFWFFNSTYLILTRLDASIGSSDVYHDFKDSTIILLFTLFIFLMSTICHLTSVQVKYHVKSLFMTFLWC